MTGTWICPLRWTTRRRRCRGRSRPPGVLLLLRLLKAALLSSKQLFQCRTASPCTILITSSLIHRLSLHTDFYSTLSCSRTFPLLARSLPLLVPLLLPLLLSLLLPLASALPPAGAWAEAPLEDRGAAPVRHWPA